MGLAGKWRALYFNFLQSSCNNYELLSTPITNNFSLISERIQVERQLYTKLLFCLAYIEFYLY